MNIVIRRAGTDDIDRVTALYGSLIGSDGCVWNEEYPCHEDAENDINFGALYIMYDADGGGNDIIGAVSAGGCEELSELKLWGDDIKKPCELSRLGVRCEYQGRGLARRLVSAAERDIVLRGYDGVRLLAYKANKNAVILYNRLHYKLMGEAEMFDIGVYLCYEKKLR